SYHPRNTSVHLLYLLTYNSNYREINLNGRSFFPLMLIFFNNFELHIVDVSLLWILLLTLGRVVLLLAGTGIGAILLIAIFAVGIHFIAQKAKMGKGALTAW
ncbi:hypothetical protein J9303_21040, partial [Bacillaceae bacterium Marseille-Q3522]|nr:hypothetical protein [Bacillaceae bacterium Marseille-Q3522]